jgi:hypothetical protein
MPLFAASAALRRHQHGWKTQSVTHTEMVDRLQHVPPELTATKNGKRWTITFHYTGKVTLDKAGPRELERCLHAGRYVIAARRRRASKRRVPSEPAKPLAGVRGCSA